MKLKVGILAVFILVFPFFSSHSVADSKPIEQFYDQGPEVKNVGGYTGVLVEDTFDLTNAQSNLVGFNFEQSNGNWTAKESFTCTSALDSKCLGAQNIWYQAVLPVCLSNIDSNCISGITAIRNGIEIPGKFSKNYPEQNKYVFTGDPSRNIPSGGLPSLWTFDGITHSGGDQFMIFAKFSHKGNWYNGGNPDTSPEQFAAGIFAVSQEKNDNYYDFNIRTQSKTSERTWWDGANNACQTTGPTGECAISWPLPKDVRFRLEIRSSIPVTNFIHGRLLDPNIKISFDADKRELISIEAGSVYVPVLHTWVKNTEMPKALHDYLYSMPNFGGFFTYIGANSTSRDEVQLLEPLDAYDERTLREYLWWLEVAKDKSIGDRSMWMVRTLSTEEINRAGSKTSSCLKGSKNLTGMVTTNAGMYIASPPTFNQATQTLDYKVAAPHLNDKGDSNIGNYNLVLNSEVARCIYGFTSAPVSATISIVSSNSTTQVATTAVREKDGWLYLSAAGYGYSDPTIKVKLTQDSAPKVAPKLIKITCVKVKITKSVTGAKPVCPSGYKKK